MGRTKPHNKRRLYEMQAQLIGALAHPIRVAIVDLLKDGEVCVCEIAQRIGAERSNTSRHLAVMLKAGVLRTRKDGLQVYYSLRTPCILNFLGCATRAIEQNIKERSKAIASA
jgi:ArsR family transcriptional regulator